MGVTRSGTRAGLSQFHELAQYYDALNASKDYRGESDRLEALARRVGRPGKMTWLDVACGTGRHLEFLSRRHPAVGVDGSAEMLRIARHRLPGVRLVRGDMRTFRLNQRFDVVSCLFSAIGHLQKKTDLQKTFDNFARHLKPGGVAIVEPWIDRSMFHPGFVRLQTYQNPAVSLARLSYSSRRAGHSIVEFHYLIGKSGDKVRYCKVTDVGLLLSREELMGAMRKAGLQPRFLSRGFTPGRGLLVGIKVEESEAPKPGRRTP
jgi:ubiquinone/menaquinone biosynthesis C-methylase UbiE